MATAKQRDPTGTLSTRNAFVSETQKRFKRLKAIITDAVVDDDIFGLVLSKTFLIGARKDPIRQRARLSRKAFAFETDPRKIEMFNLWMDRQVKAGILTVEPGELGLLGEARWTDTYIGSSYRKGINDAYIDVRKAVGGSAELAAQLPLGILSTTAEEFLRDSFTRPIHADRVRMLYTRAFDELKGITAGMSSKIGSALSQGIAEGRGPIEIASRLNREVDIGLNRARVLARTEIIRAHAEGTLNTYESMGIEDVEAEVEFSTAKDSRVCQRCRGLHGKVMSIADARGVIPVHPQCRCKWLPFIPDVSDAPEPFPKSIPSDTKKPKKKKRIPKKRVVRKTTTQKTIEKVRSDNKTLRKETSDLKKVLDEARKRRQIAEKKFREQQNKAEKARMELKKVEKERKKAEKENKILQREIKIKEKRIQDVERETKKIEKQLAREDRRRDRG